MAGDAFQASLGAPLAGVLARAWFDRAALGSLVRVYLPVSRLWAAAGAAVGDLDRFVAEAPIAPPRRPQADLIRLALARHAALATAARLATAGWQDAFFGPARPSQAVLAAQERARRLANRRWMGQRLAFLPFLRSLRGSALRFEVAPPRAAEALWSGVLDDPASGCAVAARQQAPERSAVLRAESARISWVRFPSPAPWMGDTATARVTEPVGRAALTVIAGDGLFAETGHWGVSVSQAARLAARGLRIVELDSPWHGSRMVPGRYGGEPFLATAPVGPLALLTAQARETAVLVRWCRALDGAPVALTGVSMGSFVAQLVASHAGAWPPDCRPDAVMLVVHHGRLADLMLGSRLSTGLGVHRALADAGWTDAAIARWGAAGSPSAEPGLAPERIVSVLGTADDVTPFAGGDDLARRWALPKANRFVLAGGHFSTALALAVERRPFERLCAIALGRP